MPLPLYGSGGRTLRISAAVCPTTCLSVPFTITSVGWGTSNEMPSRGMIVTGCEKPTASSSSAPLSCARYPTPWISSCFSKPFVTPSTMFAISVLVSPCSARSSPRSVGRVTVSSPSPCSIFIRCGTTCESSPSGPLTCTRPGEIATLTVLGSSMGRLPILLMPLPDERDHFAANALLGSLAARDQAGRGGQDRGAEPAEDARQTVLARVDAAAGAGHALDARDHPLAVASELELDDERRVRLALDLDDAEVLDVALVLEDAGDLLLDPGGRHLGGVLHRLVGVADPRQHVCDRVGQHLFPLPAALRHAG